MVSARPEKRWLSIRRRRYRNLGRFRTHQRADLEGAAGQVVRFTASDRILDVVAPDGERVAQNDDVVTVRLPMERRYLVRRIGTRRGVSAGDCEVAVRSDCETTDTPTLLAMNMPGGGCGEARCVSASHGPVLVRVVPASYIWPQTQTGDYEIEVRPAAATSSPR